MRATQVHIDRKTLQKNLNLLQNHVGQRRMCLAVKADAYGHGAVQTVKAAQSIGIHCFAVACVEEAAALRREGVTDDLLLLSPILPEEMEEASDLSLSLFAAAREEIEAYNAVCRGKNIRGRVHLAIDTGMGRFGCTPGEAPALADLIAGSDALLLEGTATHFPSADGGDDDFTNSQIDIFKKAVEKIRKRGINPGILHAANSGAIIDHKTSWFDMVRPGILAYGYYPSAEQDRKIPVEPVMEFRTRLLFIKKVAPGTTISYGRSWKAESERYIGTIPVGYADGYSRLLSNKGWVAIGGEEYPLAGRVCMDQTMVDLGPSLKVNLRDPVVLFGPKKPAPTAEDIGSLIGTIPYEITCMAGNSRAPRVYSL